LCDKIKVERTPCRRCPDIAFGKTKDKGNMLIQVFVSHTQKDVEFCDIFDRACAREGLKSFRSEFETIELPQWQTIRDAIRRSRALFLLIGRELVMAQNMHDSSWAHTQNWISYEIGIACERGMDVWALCDDVPINFPIPYLNNYLPSSIRRREIFYFFVKNVVRAYAQGDKLPFRDPEFSVECPGCGAVFNLWVRLPPEATIICPQCLGQMNFPEGFYFQDVVERIS
jgi:hypothetical protein